MYLYSQSTGGFYNDVVHTAEQIPADAVELTDDAYQALLEAQSAGQQITADAGGAPEATDVPAPSRADMVKQAAAQVNHLLDAAVQARDYDSIESACSYATSTVDAWQAEALACSAWRDQVWQWFYAEVAAGTDDVPGPKQLRKAMPALSWPKG